MVGRDVTLPICGQSRDYCPESVNKENNVPVKYSELSHNVVNYLPRSGYNAGLNLIRANPPKGRGAKPKGLTRVFVKTAGLPELEKEHRTGSIVSDSVVCFFLHAAESIETDSRSI